MQLKPRVLLVGLYLGLVLLLAACGSAPSATGRTTRLTIAYTNDLEGALDPCSCLSQPAGGAPRRATAVTQLRKEHPDLLLVDSGDALFGAVVADATGGRVQIAVMNELGYQAAAIGDRDFRYGLDVLLDAVHAARFPFLSANVILAESGKPLTQASTLVKAGGLRVAIIGLTSPSVQALWDQDTAMRAKLKLLDPVAAVQKLVPELVRQADAVVILSHLGPTRDRQLAEQVAGITAIIGGHDRKVYDPPQMLGNGVPRVEMGYQGDYLGVLGVDVVPGGRPAAAQTSNVHLTADIKTDESIVALLTHYKALAVLNGKLPLSGALTIALPLEVHRAAEGVQRAYIFAAAFPEQLASRPAPSGAPGVESLLGCFVSNPQADDYKFEYRELAAQTPDCVAQALDVLPALPPLKENVRIAPGYWPDE